MSRPVIAHLVDDTTAGGVMRFLDTLATSRTLAAQAEHRVVPVRRGRMPGPLGAAMVVSHLSVSWRTLPALIAMRARFAGLPFVHVEHSYSAAFETANVARRDRFRLLLRTAYALFDEVVAVSRAQGSWLSGTGLVAPERLRVIRPAVDLAPFLAIPSRIGPVRRLGALGRLDPQKGFDLLVEAVTRSALPGVSLDIVGDGPERDRLVDLAGGDPRIAFRPFAADPAAAMARMDAILMPSRWEPYGLVALEARAAGRPLLVSTADGLRDHAAAGAIAVTQADAAGWAEAIGRLVEDGPGASAAQARSEAAQAPGRMELAWRGLVGRMLDGCAPETVPAA